MKASAEEEKKYEIIKTPLKKYVWRSGDVVEIPMICADKQKHRTAETRGFDVHFRHRC